VLALPNDISGPFVEAVDANSPDTVVVDLSSDHRFDQMWQYGQTERFRDDIRKSLRLANPGCYATGAQLTLAPFIDILDGAPKVFGVSGFSGAGTTPNPRNDQERLADNLMPYKLTGHTHEREVSRHLGHEIHFTPHVAEFFRGISLTVSIDFADAQTREGLQARLDEAYADEPLIRLTDEIPQVKDNAGEHHVCIGGLEVADDGRHAVLVATLDNLLKGAATQAMQNLNLMCGYDELRGIR
jgi:N-acetyl-gamma-glutamyl-phosphate reductase